MSTIHFLEFANMFGDFFWFGDIQVKQPIQYLASAFF